MCGIAGFWARPADAASLTEQAGFMADALSHRGPDDRGVWIDAARGVGLGFRRLAILDLSVFGHQPMTSVEGRYTVVFNGEIFNFRELKTELVAAGHPFRGGSDTEVMLAGFSRWGIADTLLRITGMFAIAAWDAAEQQLTLARDRVGKKPLYYGRAEDGAWIFGSELKALQRYGAFTPKIDRDALVQFFRYGYVPAPRSIFCGIKKLLPGHRVTLGFGDERAPEPYWDPASAARRGDATPLQLSDDEAVGQLLCVLGTAVAQRMVADVPLGAFLSGGLDSSLIVALMQAQSTRPVRTFTVGFDVPGYNEAVAANAVAAHLGTDHTELYVTPQQTRDVIPLLPAIYDEPFGDSSGIPTYLVSKLARSHVTVALSGDGGDELFSGYNRYFWAPAIWKRARPLPLVLRRAVSATIGATSPALLDAAYAAVERPLPSSWRVARPADKLHKMAAIFDARDETELYTRLVSAWHDPARLVRGGREAPVGAPQFEPREFCERMMFRDLLTYLPDDILTKVDRASMASSLEVRSPLLDHRVIEWAWSLPSRMRVRDGTGKWLLRRLLHRYVPATLVERPKMGFGIPIDEWLRGPLKEWANDLLSEASLDTSELNSEPIRLVWQSHLRGHRNESARLWPVLMFQAWRRMWRP